MAERKMNMKDQLNRVYERMRRKFLLQSEPPQGAWYAHKLMIDGVLRREKERKRQIRSIKKQNKSAKRWEGYWVSRVFEIFQYAITYREQSPPPILTPKGTNNILFFPLSDWPCYLCVDKHTECSGIPRAPRCIADHKRFLELCREAGFDAGTTSCEHTFLGMHACPESIRIVR